MAKLVVSEEVSLDGVVQDPTGEEGFRHGGWFNQIGEETRRAWAEVKNSTVLEGDVVREVTRLKRELDGELVVFASRALAQTLLEHDLVDEVRLTVYPVVLGDGELLFGELSDQRPLRLLEARMLGEGLAQLYYERARD